MTVNTTTSTTAQAARDRQCPLCGRKPGRPCQRKPSAELVVIHPGAMVRAGAR